MRTGNLYDYLQQYRLARNIPYDGGDGPSGDGPSGGSTGCSSISVMVTEVDTTSAYIHWNNPNNAPIKVLSFAGRNIALNLPSSAAYRVTGLSPGTDYFILVADVNNCMGSIGFTTPKPIPQQPVFQPPGPPVRVTQPPPDTYTEQPRTVSGIGGWIKSHVLLSIGILGAGVVMIHNTKKS